MKSLKIIFLAAAVVFFAACNNEPLSGDTDITADFDPQFAALLKKRGYIPDAEKIIFSDVKNIDKIDVSRSCDNNGKNTGKLTSLAGIEYFHSLTSLSCHTNQLTTLDVSKNTTLTARNLSLKLGAIIPTFQSLLQENLGNTPAKRYRSSIRR